MQGEMAKMCAYMRMCTKMCARRSFESLSGPRPGSRTHQERPGWRLLPRGCSRIRFWDRGATLMTPRMGKSILGHSGDSGAIGQQVHQSTTYSPAGRSPVKLSWINFATTRIFQDSFSRAGCYQGGLNL